MKLMLIYSTFPNKKVAKEVAKQLVQEKLIACANLFDKGLSIYEWANKMNQSSECYVIFKTSFNKYKKAIKKLKALHPYETAALLCWSVDSLNPDYSIWVKRSTTD